MLGQREARWLVDQYYQIQDFRIQSANQVRQSGEEEPNRVLSWMAESMRRLESDIQKALGEFSDQYTIGQWMQSITGIGPVISAGLLSHLDVRECKTAGHFWRFAGMDPTQKWEKKQKRPWNAKLKCLCWKASECFVKFQNHKNDFYGKLYVERKAYEIARNESGGNADAAKAALEAKNYRAETDTRKAYESGILPPAHIHARAERWVSKLFLSHIHHAMWVDYYGTEPLKPYAFEKCPGDHRHFIDLPNWPFKSSGKSLRELLVDEPTALKEPNDASEAKPSD